MTTKDRRNLLKAWVLKNEQKNQVEAHIVLERTKKQKYKGTKECLSVREMFLRKWPRNKILGAISKGGGIRDEHCPDDPTLTSYWCVTSRKLQDVDEQRQTASCRMDASVDAGALDILTGNPSSGSMGTAAAMEVDPAHMDALQASIGSLEFGIQHKLLVFKFCSF